MPHSIGLKYRGARKGPASRSTLRGKFATRRALGSTNRWLPTLLDHKNTRSSSQDSRRGAPILNGGPHSSRTDRFAIPASIPPGEPPLFSHPPFINPTVIIKACQLQRFPHSQSSWLSRQGILEDCPEEAAGFSQDLAHLLMWPEGTTWEGTILSLPFKAERTSPANQ